MCQYSQKLFLKGTWTFASNCIQILFKKKSNRIEDIQYRKIILWLAAASAICFHKWSLQNCPSRKAALENMKTWPIWPLSAPRKKKAREDKRRTQKPTRHTLWSPCSSPRDSSARRRPRPGANFRPSPRPATTFRIQIDHLEEKTGEDEEETHFVQAWLYARGWRRGCHAHQPGGRRGRGRAWWCTSRQSRISGARRQT